MNFRFRIGNLLIHNEGRYRVINNETEKKIHEQISKLWEIGYNIDDFVVLMKLSLDKCGISYKFVSSFGDIVMRHSELLKDNEFIIVPATYTPTPRICKCCGQLLPK